MQDIAEAIRSTLTTATGEPTCGPSKIPDAVQALGKALCPLLDSALQQQDWCEPRHLLDLDACSMLLLCLSQHLHKCYRTPWMANLPRNLRASGNDWVLPLPSLSCSFACSMNQLHAAAQP